MLFAKERLAELFQKQLDGKLSQDEKEELALYAMQEDLQPLLRQMIEEAWNITGEEADLPQDKVRDIKESILSGNGTRQDIIHIPKTRTLKWWAAAAVLLLVAIGAVLWYTGTKMTPASQPDLVIAEDIKPGSNGAILTLSDGRRIELDSMGNSIVSDSNGIKAELKDGMLTYTANQKADHQILFHTVTTPRGKQFQLQLPDGSHVWLNTASSITYPATFHGNDRQVSVTGEVYFEVKNTAAAPFIVSSNQQKVMVLGTRFNINSYDDDIAVKTTLRDGKVRVTANGNGGEKILVPGQQSRVVANDPIQVKEVDIDQVLAWQMGYFNFSNTSFADIMKQLSRWYNIDVKFENKIPEIEFEGKLNQSVNLSRVLEFFKESGIKFRLENHTLIIL